MNPSDTEALLQSVTAQAHNELAPLADAIDREGLYPEAYLRKLGELGGYGAAIPREWGGLGADLALQIQVTARVGAVCGATAFLVWSQSSCAWYLLHAANAAARTRYLAAVTKGELLAGTGMSNSVKHLAGIERILLEARRDGDAYIVNGILPWVSNIGADHLVIVAAAVPNEGYVMFAVRGDAAGLELHPCPPFSGMEGTQTLNMRFHDVRIAADDVLAHPHQFCAFMTRIKPGFMLGQAGMALGVIENSLKTIRDSNATHEHVNVYLDDQYADLVAERDALQDTALRLAREAQAGLTPALPALKARAQASELTLRAANSAVLHAGAKGYLMRHPAQRRLREAVFVAIVTPALKHLRKEIHDLELAQSEAA